LHKHFSENGAVVNYPENYIAISCYKTFQEAQTAFKNLNKYCEQIGLKSDDGELSKEKKKIMRNFYNPKETELLFRNFLCSRADLPELPAHDFNGGINDFILATKIM